MAIEAAFAILSQQLDRLQEEIRDLQLNLTDYYPLKNCRPIANGEPEWELAPPPVVSLADKTSDMGGAIEEALSSGREAGLAIRHPRRLVETQLALITIQHCLNRTLTIFLAEVAPYDTVQTLVEMGRELGGSWPQWTDVVKVAINTCGTRLEEAFRALAECWEELVEKFSADSASMYATNIGQQITTRESIESTNP
jgi:hypothetical protein